MSTVRNVSMYVSNWGVWSDWWSVWVWFGSPAPPTPPVLLLTSDNKDPVELLLLASTTHPYYYLHLSFCFTVSLISFPPDPMAWSWPLPDFSVASSCTLKRWVEPGDKATPTLPHSLPPLFNHLPPPPHTHSFIVIVLIQWTWFPQCQTTSVMSYKNDYTLFLYMYLLL